MTESLHAVRVTQEPGVVRNVSDAELLDLARSGILHSYEHTDAAALVLEGTVFAKPKAWKPAERGEKPVVAGEPVGASAPATVDTKGA